MKVLVTGSGGFIAGYLVAELLDHGYEVVGLDNFSKYGRLTKSYDAHPGFRCVVGDAKEVDLLKELLAGCEHFVAGAAMVGGIPYFHKYAYDLLAENERLTAAAFDAAIAAHHGGRLVKITVMSSSMVFESTSTFPTPEGEELLCPPPRSTYGFQKLACEYFARGACQQYGLPYTILRPFNCVGIGESRALGDACLESGDVKEVPEPATPGLEPGSEAQLAMSHVVPDLVQKVLRGQDPLHVLGSGEQVRHYTYGGDLARGIRLAMEHPDAVNEDFNLSSPAGMTVLDLAEMIWRKVRPKGGPLRYVCDEPFAHDVQERVPDVSKAQRVLGFQALTPIDAVLDEVIPWVRRQIESGRI